MIIIDCEQCSPEWFAHRVGTPSASQFDKIVTMKGDPSKQAEKYMYQLAGERVIGRKEETYCNDAMKRGIEMEPEARALYEMLHDVELQQVGLCYPDERKQYACSPDGLIGEDGGLEIKCPSLAVHVEYLLGKRLPATYHQQVHGSIHITGRKWWDFMSYYPGMKPFIIRVFPDPKFNMALGTALNDFCAKLDGISTMLKAA